MIKESVIIFTALISAFSALCGVLLSWFLNNISKESDHVQSERVRIQSKLENHYVGVISCIEEVLRSRLKGDDFNQKLSHSNSVLKLFSSSNVQTQFDDFAIAFKNFHDVVRDSGQEYARYTNASEDFPDEWRHLLHKRDSIVESMKADISSLDFYGVGKQA